MDDSKVILMILDGWGHGKIPKVDAIAQANTPNIDSLYNKYPHSELITFGKKVGLPKGQMGNSEVGHLNIGAGRVVYQELARINKAIEERTFHKNQILIKALIKAKLNNRTVHLMGLLSDGGIHSHINHLKALIDITEDQQLEKVYIHAFTDGRDTAPQSGLGFIRDLLNYTKDKKAKLVSVIGRYYAMDRDKRWEKTKKAYDLLVHGKGKSSKDLIKSIQQSYDDGISDEFILPIISTDENGSPITKIKNNDLIIFFNFRTDRPRQLTEVLSQSDKSLHGMKKLNLHYITMTKYDERFKKIDVLYTKENIKDTLGEVLEKAGKTQTRIAETEKYPHVTFFFSGGREKGFKGERRLLANSPKVATYDLQPEMSALELAKKTCNEIETNRPDFICLNFANTDMVGHTGNFKAAMIAAEMVDKCVMEILDTALSHNYSAIIIADHGNSDFMINPDGTPHTAHTMNLVPCIFVSNNITEKKLKDGKLADIAPTILALLNIKQPSLMDGNNLIYE